MTVTELTRPLRIAMIGQRGVPATYGGVERHVEEVGARLVERGHEVTVYTRSSYAAGGETYRGMRVRPLPAMEHKHLQAISHSLISSVHAAPRRFDVVHYHAVGPGLASPLVRYGSTAKVVLTVHGLDSQRAKWGPVTKRVLNAATWMSANVPDATVVVSRALSDYYGRRYASTTDVIHNGVAPREPRPPGAALARWGLRAGRYLLFVGRFVPEKAPDRLVRAFQRMAAHDPDLQLVLAGGSSFTDEYAEQVADLAKSDSRVRLPGYVYGDDLAELYSNAAAFVLPSDVEGMPLTLLEAAAYGLPVVVSDIEPHLEVVEFNGPGRRLFQSGSDGDLVRALTLVADGLAAERAAAAALQTDVIERFSWDDAVEQLEAVYARVARRRRVVLSQSPPNRRLGSSTASR